MRPPGARAGARRAAAAGRPQLAAGVAIDGKRLAGARRSDGGRVHLLSATSHAGGIVVAQRRIHDKTNEIPELAPLTAELGLTGKVVTIDALHTQRETARWLVEDCHADYLMIIKENQPHLLAAAYAALDGPDADFAATSHTEDDRGHGRTEQRAIRTAPAPATATDTDWPYAAQFARIIRRTGGLDGVTTSKEVAYAVTSLSPDAAGPAALATHVRNHWTCENKTHYVRDVTFGEDKSQTRTGNTPQNLAALRNVVIGTYRAAGYANIAHARRDHAADPNLTINLFFGPHLTQSKSDRSPP